MVAQQKLFSGALFLFLVVVPTQANECGDGSCPQVDEPDWPLEASEAAAEYRRDLQAQSDVGSLIQMQKGHLEQAEEKDAGEPVVDMELDAFVSILFEVADSTPRDELLSTSECRAVASLPHCRECIEALHDNLTPDSLCSVFEEGHVNGIDLQVLKDHIHALQIPSSAHLPLLTAATRIARSLAEAESPVQIAEGLGAAPKGIGDLATRAKALEARYTKLVQRKAKPASEASEASEHLEESLTRKKIC